MRASARPLRLALAALLAAALGSCLATPARVDFGPPLELGASVEGSAQIVGERAVGG